MLLYTVKYGQIRYDVVGNNFQEVISALNKELNVFVSPDKVQIRSVVLIPSVRLSDKASPGWSGHCKF